MADKIEIPQELESLDGVPEVLHGFYTETEEGGYKLEDVSALKNALGHVRKERDRAKTQMKKLKAELEAKPAVSDDDLEELEQLRKKIADMDGKDDKPDIEEIVAKHTKKLRADFDKEIKDRDDKIGRLSGALERTMVDSALMRELAAAGATEEGLKALPMALRPSIKFTEEDGQFQVQVIGDDGLPETNTKTGDSLTLADFVKGKKEEFPSLFKGTGASGGGASHGAGSRGALPANLKPASEMTPFEKSAFIAEYGQDKFFEHAGLKLNEKANVSFQNVDHTKA